MNLRELVEGSLVEAAKLSKSDLIIGGLGAVAFGGSYCFDYKNIDETFHYSGAVAMSYGLAGPFVFRAVKYLYERK
ncbi:hypothetical protein HZA99_05945 [Candidatus Woesearchaeota archaeon]|nr:hypothetical protein [Candidatus Woesearchaeota archaeon]